MLQDEERLYIINTYNRQPGQNLWLVRGKGTLVYDENGKEYLDFVGGLAVNALGHCYPPVVAAAKEQMQKLLHTSNLYYTEPQVKLAKCLVENSQADKVFFCNSGAEANEAAIKLARKYAKMHAGEEKFEIITALRSFHGRTLATLTATGQEKFHKGFAPLLPGFRYAEFNNLASFQSQINEHTCAILVEPVQGEGGIFVAEKEFLQGLRHLCDEHGLLLILDEVQSGMGRTGKLFAHEHYDIVPDIFTLAKALGGGFPIGAMLCTGEVAKGFAPGDHASTFGGNPVICAASLAVLQTLLQEGFLDTVLSKGAYLLEKLLALQKDHPGFIKEVRGKGLMIGVGIAEGSPRIREICQEKGLLVNSIGDNTLRLLPSLNVTEAEIDAAQEIIGAAVAQYLY
ncbi:MAG: aspartate aminotransferase family protein [Dethiobacteria bacterium]|jgi:acetylornithine/N-succinyldiaminopimelate aminotransferase